MGVPSFYRWICTRYPRCVDNLSRLRQRHHSEQQGGANVVDYDDDNADHGDGSSGSGGGLEACGFPCDNLYLDMNGIIHPCFHPEGGGPQPQSEEEVFERILARVDNLISLVAPRKLVYLAVDGPAPRAKMNQQRARRFRAAQDAEQERAKKERARERAAREGRAHDFDERASAEKAATMDSNVITPGTVFMAKLGRWLRHWAYMKLNEIEKACCEPDYFKLPPRQLCFGPTRTSALWGAALRATHSTPKAGRAAHAIIYYHGVQRVQGPAAGIIPKHDAAQPPPPRVSRHQQ